MAQKIAYVTGGMGGIGTSMCQRLHKDGFKVIAGCGPSRDHVKWIGEQKALGYTFYASVGNVGDWDSTVDWERVSSILLSAQGRLRVAMLNGAVEPKYSTPRRVFLAAGFTTGCGTSVAAVWNFFSNRCTL